jgi:hypothetical protein
VNSCPGCGVVSPGNGKAGTGRNSTKPKERIHAALTKNLPRSSQSLQRHAMLVKSSVNNHCMDSLWRHEPLFPPNSATKRGWSWIACLTIGFRSALMRSPSSLVRVEGYIELIGTANGDPLDKPLPYFGPVLTDSASRRVPITVYRIARRKSLGSRHWVFCCGGSKAAAGTPIEYSILRSGF